MTRGLSMMLMVVLVAAGGGACSNLESLTPTPDNNWVGESSWSDERVLQWAPDGSRVWYSRGPGLYSVGVNDASMEVIVDPVVNRGDYDSFGGVVSAVGDSWYGSSLMLHFDVSPDGSRVAYSTCRYHKEPQDLRAGRANYCRAGYEIVTAKIDGTSARRLTKNDHFDNFPVWSPNGDRLAYISDNRPSGDDVGPHNPESWGVKGRLVIRNMATGQSRVVARSFGNRVAPHPPKWSPDGRRLAFVVYEDKAFSNTGRPGDEYMEGLIGRRRVVYTVRPDGSNLMRVADAFSEPSWSPDSQRLAFAVPAGERDLGAHLYTFAADGSDPALVTKITDQYSLWSNYPFWMGKVHWSPDGSRIMYTKPEAEEYEEDGCRVCVVTVHGGHVSNLEPFHTDSHFLHPIRLPELLAWSPNGSRIAVLPRGEDLLYTIDSGGNDARIIVPVGEAGRSQDEVVEACANGVVVPDPENNAGLVEDCRTLLRIRYVLGGDTLNYWNPYTPITGWGPRRGTFYQGTTTPMGSIELHLRPVRVAAVVIRGSVERGDDMHLFGNIPVELGDLANLERLDLSKNRLRGGIPAELGNLTQLKALNLSFNGLTGHIPPELGNLTNLESLDLSYTEIGGPIPTEMAGLVNLRDLRLLRTNLTCVPTGLPPIWVQSTGLPLCE